MKIELLTLSKDFNFNTKGSFPETYKDELKTAIQGINYEHNKRRSLDYQIDDLLSPLGYFSEVKNKKECQLWKDSKHSVDFYSKEKKIAIEVEKAEVKRVIHDVIKLLKAANENIIEYGVLIIPREYKTDTKTRVFFDRVKSEMQFYIKDLFSCSQLKDILFIVYES